MANAATHQGHCQVCGKRHMLPDGILAKHGYTVDWGFFRGVCRGAGHVPFEQDISLIEGMIAWADGESANLNDRAAKLEAPATSPAVEKDVWVKDAIKSRRGPRSGYVRMRGNVVAEQHMDGNYTWNVYTLEVEGQRAGRYRLDERGDTVLEVATKLNQRIADGLRAKAAELTKYANWQRARIAGWVAHPEKLRPIKDQSKLKFAVGMTVRIGGKNGSDETIVAIEDRTCRGCGPYLNGQILPHAVFTGQNGRNWARPLRSIRLPKEA